MDQKVTWQELIAFNLGLMCANSKVLLRTHEPGNNCSSLLINPNRSSWKDQTIKTLTVSFLKEKNPTGIIFMSVKEDASSSQRTYTCNINTTGMVFASLLH